MSSGADDALGARGFGRTDDGPQIMGIFNAVTKDDQPFSRGDLCQQFFQGDIRGIGFLHHNALMIFVAAKAFQFCRVNLFDGNAPVFCQFQNAGKRTVALTGGNKDLFNVLPRTKRFHTGIPSGDDIFKAFEFPFRLAAFCAFSVAAMVFLFCQGCSLLLTP